MMGTTDLAYVRSQAEDALPDTVDLQTYTRISDGQGGFTESWASAYQSVPARLAPTTGRERLRAGARSEEAESILTVAWDQTLDATMRVLHQDSTYEIILVLGHSYLTAKRALLKRL